MQKKPPDFQKTVWLQSEGDAWLQRNPRPTSFHAEKEIIEFVSRSSLTIKNVLEVGCSSGEKIDFLARQLKCQGVGVDPSNRAIKLAERAFGSNIEFAIGTADDLPTGSTQFDLVYAGFFLSLVDRSLLFTSLTSIDNATREGGLLVITDFDSTSPISVSYKHHPGVVTYKNDYASMFVSTGLYSIAHKMSFSHVSAGFSNKIHERLHVTILYKEEHHS